MSDEQGSPEEVYKEFLKEKHAKFQVSDAVVAAEVTRATNSASATKTRLILGENSEVYDIKTEDGQDVIMRISRNNYPRFEEEKWAIDKAAQAGVPVPQVFLTDKVLDGIQELPICIQRKLPGIPLDQRSDLSPEQYRKFIAAAGEQLSRIHSVETTGYGELDPNGMGPYTTWDGYLLSLLDRGNLIIKASREGGYSEDSVKNGLEIINDNRPLFQGVPSHLLHADFGPKHIMTQGDKITGIFDFENCKAGDPIQDIASWDFWYGDQIPFEWLKEGYTNKDIFDDPNFAKKLDLYKLHFGLNILEYNHTQGNKSGFNHAAQQINRVLPRLIPSNIVL